MMPKPLSCLVGAALFLGLALSAAPSPAADSLSVLTERVDRLTRDLADLRNQFYLGQSGGGSPQTLAPGQAGSIETRLAAFEQELRNLTGMVEQLNHQQTQLNDRIDRLQADVEYRLTTLEGGTPSASTDAGTGASTAGAALNTSSQSASAATTTNQDIAAATQADIKPLGTTAQTAVEQGTAANVAQPQPVTPQTAPATAAAPAGATLPAGSPKQQYDYAFGLLRQANYDGAEQALSAFIQQNPSDPLAANAKYWLGETYYVRGNYTEAARAFGVSYQDHPNGPKATDSLLKLGLSLSLLGRNADACAVFNELEGQFPDAAANVLQRSQQERGRLGC
ncbi:MAG TPA: tol-pal system protein YbgF [Kiloniellales bacterium]|nr:tol-pal system protein YbgF [Kiloniellales bacterium]